MFLWGIESSSKPASADATYLLFLLHQSMLLPHVVQDPLSQSLEDHELLQNFKLKICDTWRQLRGNSL